MSALPHFLPSRVFTPLALAALLGLGACGGGGGGGDDDTPPAASTASLSGVASKGLLKYAQVAAYQVDASGEKELQSKFTDENGNYEFTGLPTGVVIIVKITAVAASGSRPATQMVDEANDAVITLTPGSLSLRAAVVLEASSTVGSATLHVTPFSEMAVAKAVAAGGAALTKDMVAAAYEDLRISLKIDPYEKPTFDASGTQPTNGPALLLAAVSELVASSGLGCTDTDAVERMKCVIGSLSSRGTKDEALLTELNDAKAAAVIKEGYQGSIPLDAEPQPAELIPVAQRDAIKDAKALMASVRNSGAAFNGLGAKLDGVNASLRTALQPLASARAPLLQTLTLATQKLDQYAQGQYTGALPYAASDVITPNVSGALAAGCTLYSDAAFETEATTYQNADYAVCRVTYADVSSAGQRHVYQQMFSVSPKAGVTSGRGYTVTSSVVKQQIRLDTAYDLIGLPANWIGGPQILSDFHDADATVTGSGSNLTSVALDGDLANAVAKDGAVGGEILTVHLSLSAAALTDGSGLSRLSITGLISTVSEATDEEVGVVRLVSGSHVDARLVTPGEVNSGVLNNDGAKGHFVLEATTDNGSQVSGTLDVSEYRVSGGGDEWPTKVVFAGQVKEGGGTLLFEGQVSLMVSDFDGFDPSLPGSDDSAENFLPKQMAFQGTLHAPEAQPLSINVNLNNATFGRVAGSGTLQQGERTVNIVANDDHLTGLWSLTLSGPGGLRVELSKANQVSQITGNGGLVVGSVNSKAGRIDYADGTFESL